MATQDLVALSRGQHTELIAIGIGHDHPADLTLPDVDVPRPQGDEAVDLGVLIAVDGWSDVEVQPVLAGLRLHWWSAPGDLRTAVWGANRGLLVLIPHQRPAECVAPEVPDLLRPVARQRSDEAAVGQERVPRLDDAELVALGICEHHMSLLRAL